MAGKFISFEGPDGAGKTSVITAIQAELEQQLGKEKVMYTREPGDTDIAETIRRVLLDEYNLYMDGLRDTVVIGAVCWQRIE